MKKADFLKAARAAAPHVDAQIAWLESQDCGDDDKAWFQAIDVLRAESSALWERIEACKAKGQALEAQGGLIQEAYWSIEGNAFDTARDEGWDMDQLENQARVWEMATSDCAIADWLANNPA